MIIIQSIQDQTNICQDQMYLLYVAAVQELNREWDKHRNNHRKNEALLRDEQEIRLRDREENQEKIGK